jgi:Reeler domain
MLLTALVSVRAYPKGAPPGVTGGFGEQTCNECHDSFALNAGRAAGLGDVVITGFPKEYRPGDTYPIKVELTQQQDSGVWGFQLATRAQDTHAQAGTLKPLDSHTQILSMQNIDYITHTAEGTFSNVFEFTWVAPSTAVGAIVVNAAANAANGDASPVGDYIYSTSLSIAASH